MTVKLSHFDAHCHLFNLQYLGLEAGHMLRDALENDYPHQQVTAGAFPRDAISSIREFISWLHDLGEAGFDSEEEHLKQIFDAGASAWNDKLSMSCIPLMMDIYFLFDEPVGAGKSAPRIARRRKSLWAWFLRRIMSDCSDYYDSLGFRKERKVLLSMVKRHRGKVFPFFAVDPRRTGVIDEVRKGKLVSKQGPFYGIKLYPRMGVHPLCRDLEPLYDWCVANRIPIITHCDSIGFPPPALEKILKYNFSEYGNPMNFEVVLKEHPDLTIDFAHFGMTAPEWGATIAHLMQVYPNVYSDLSCYTTGTVVKAFKEKWWSQPHVAERTLFGTDYDVNVAVTPGLLLDEYYRNFQNEHNPGAFSPEELYQMSVINPVRFLA